MCVFSFAGPLPYFVGQVYESTEQVLLMEKLDGITGYEAEQKWAEGKVVDVFGQDQRVLLYSAWGAMLAGETLVHADAHPGNFMASRLNLRF